MFNFQPMSCWECSFSSRNNFLRLKSNVVYLRPQSMKCLVVFFFVFSLIFFFWVFSCEKSEIRNEFRFDYFSVWNEFTSHGGFCLPTPWRRCYHQLSIICFQLETYYWWPNLESVSYLWRKQEMTTLSQKHFCYCLENVETKKVSFEIQRTSH